MSVISVDFYGSLDRDPLLWKELLKYVKLEGMKVYVVSGPWPDAIIKKLEFREYSKGVHYDNAFSILSHLGTR